MTNELHPGEVLTAETVGLLDRGRITHDVKCWPEPFEAVRSRQKPWELRLNDRDYRVGDTLRQHKWDPKTETYTGDIDEQDVVWALYGPAFGLPDGYVIMTLSASDEGRGSLPAAPSVPTELDPTTGRPFGDHGTGEDAIEFVLSNDCTLGEDAAFLRCWQEGSTAEEWPKFYIWLNEKHPATHPQEAASVHGEGGAVSELVSAALAMCQTHRAQLYPSEFARLKAAAVGVQATATHPAREDGPAGQWQDIATAPKDGSRFLAYGGGLDDEVETCSWSGQTACWNLESFTADDRDDEPQGYCRPTHWMPLPAAPTKEPA